MKSTIHNKRFLHLTRLLHLLYFGCLTATRLFSAEEEIKEITQTGRMLKKEGDVNYWRTGQPEVPATQPLPQEPPPAGKTEETHDPDDNDSEERTAGIVGGPLKRDQTHERQQQEGG